MAWLGLVLQVDTADHHIPDVGVPFFSECLGGQQDPRFITFTLLNREISKNS